jgi:acyl carrier protein
MKLNKIMDEIKNYLSEYIKEQSDADDYDINNSVLNLYMDSLDIVDLVIEIEKHYDITIDDYNDWDEMYLDDIVKYIKNKLG